MCIYVLNVEVCVNTYIHTTTYMYRPRAWTTGPASSSIAVFVIYTVGCQMHIEQCHIYTYTHTGVYVFVYICIYMRVYVCMFVCMYACLCMYVCMYVHACMHVCMHVCMYVGM